MADVEAIAPGQDSTWPAGRRAALRLALLYVVGLALLWSLLPLLLQTVPHADNVEQLNWAHSFEWGYIKHPPLPTWLLIGASRFVRPGAGLTYALAMGCVAATLLLLWRCGALLFDRRGALAVLLLSSANYYLMGRGSFLNHNTVMLPFVAASAWAVLRIVPGGRAARPAGWQVWLLLGLAQGLGLLTKYQMAVVIAANFLALAAAGAWRQPRFRMHALVATAATALPLLPHLLWLQQHDYPSFSYAGQSLLAGLAPGQRLVRALAFLAQQIGRFAPAIVAAGLVALLARRGVAPRVAFGAHAGRAPGAAPADAPAPGPASLPPQLLRVVALLALVPVAAVLVLTLFLGVAPQNHWGASTTLLLPLLAVAGWPRLRRAAPLAMLGAVLVVQVAAAIWVVVAAERDPQFHHTFAARPLAAQALAYWAEHTAQPLAILVGPDWETGALSLEMPTLPDVIASGERRQAPWIDDARLAQCGALVFWRPGPPAADQVGSDFAARLRDPRTLQASGPHGTTSTLGVGIIAPARGGC